jgi:phage terminase large subunit-like protein
LYDGIDISECDDLSAAVYVWPIDDEGIFYVDADFWITAAAAKRYEEDNGIQYSKWAAAGDITIVPDKTISEKVRRGIAQSIISKSEPYEHKADCYDRYKIDTTLAELEGEGRTCVPVAQGYSVSPGCNELERRLIEDSIAIAPNAVLRFCAENCEVMSDVKGNIYPVKPNRKGKYAGERSAKIDGIAALVTCLVEARKHAFPEKQEFMQKGFLSICKVSTSQTRQGNPSGSSTSAAPATSTR